MSNFSIAGGRIKVGIRKFILVFRRILFLLIFLLAVFVFFFGQIKPMARLEQLIMTFLDLSCQKKEAK